MINLEDHLKEARAINPDCEGDIETLRQVLMGNIGTNNQRNSLIRLITQLRTTEVTRPRMKFYSSFIRRHIAEEHVGDFSHGSSRYSVDRLRTNP